ncbi:MAG: hypothetical protein KGS72_14805 [Cyanobacteria bacterium REEB67]|nr:hypothetical protein [Cyanobacteria bacterium REEB67]
MHSHRSSQAKTPASAIRALALSTAAAIAFSSLIMSGCGLSPEAMKKERAAKLELFAKTVTEHLLDKNPETLKMSITTFMRDEVNDTERDKLQELKIIPDSPISVERIEQENAAAGRSNTVSVTSVKALTPVEQDSVKFQVIGTEVSKVKEKVVDTRPFNYELTVLLNPEMSGYPRLTDLKGFNVPAATADSSNQNKGSKRSRRKRG